MEASGLLRICPPVLEATEPGEKDGVGCQGEHEASERSREEWARRACGVDEGLHPERPQARGPGERHPAQGRRQGTGELAGHETVRKSAH